MVGGTSVRFLLTQATVSWMLSQMQNFGHLPDCTVWNFRASNIITDTVGRLNILFFLRKTKGNTNNLIYLIQVTLEGLKSSASLIKFAKAAEFEDLVLSSAGMFELAGLMAFI